ncbi:TonB-dependent receptor domain-containing protein [Pedobacter gandavensis]|uniref:TonB-dependent receptor n=1 Tax=Pedobacter gandavensis TaxID=2679963 RepID=A0ABR6EXX3_9SPHI|nr:TonB-dependent receptor [Pedobacter gandavensis]MBB2150084.1 TonB-dependent receptor [Pedobacter gandavensis]
MMKKYILALLCTLSIAMTSKAQQNISGKLLDEKAQHIPFASVLVLRSTDSVKAYAVMTDTAGNFMLSGVKNGKYLIKISYIGYVDYYSPVIELTELKTLHHLGSIRLNADSRLLNTVNISGQRPLIEQTLDKTVMNIEKSIFAEGNTALELLNKAPGVTVTENGEVSLKGRSGTTVMINGKPTYLSGDQLANLLRGTNSSSISRIEIMANPTSKFDAAGSGGIVNIIIKKNLLLGFNGSINGNIGAGKDIRYGEGIALSYNTALLNTYGSYNANNQNLESNSNAERLFYNDNHELLQSIRQENQEKAKLRSHNFRLGIDLNLGEKNTLGFLMNGAIGKYPTQQPSSSTFRNANGETLWTAFTQTNNKENWTDLLYNANYVHKFNKDGHELKADVDYVYHYSKMNQSLDTRYLLPEGTTNIAPSGRRGNIPSNDDIYAAKVDYSLPLNKKSKLEAGWKGSNVRTENNLQYDTLKNNTYLSDAGTSNHFIYKEHIQAAYINLNTAWSKYQLQAGLRAEYTNTKAEQISTNTIFKKDYLGFFPSLLLTRDFNEKHQVKTGYSRRIKRPGYWDLNPFRVYDDPFAFYEGNPHLKPAIVNAIELGYGFQSRYFVTLSYNHTGNVIAEQVGRLNNGTTTFQRPENIGSFDNFGLSITASTQIFKWWTGSQFLNVYHNRYKVNTSSGSDINKGNTLSINSQNTFILGKGWKSELSAFYISEEVSGISTTKPYSIISAGIQKEVLKGKGSLKFMMNDIFEGYRIKRKMAYESVIFLSRSNSDSRYGLLSFSYRFGAKGTPSNERSTSSEDLKERM